MKTMLTLSVGSVLALTATAAPARASHQEVMLVESWYRAYLGRSADPFGMQTWVHQLRCAGPDAVQAAERRARAWLDERLPEEGR